MTNNREIHQFVENKLYLLNKCIGINRELLAVDTDMDSMNSLIEQRGLVLKTLQDLGTTTDQTVISRCSQAQKDSINRAVTLLLDLDRELIESLSEKKSELMSAIRNTVKSKKVLKYASQDINSAGTFLNLKK